MTGCITKILKWQRAAGKNIICSTGTSADCKPTNGTLHNEWYQTKKSQKPAIMSHKPNCFRFAHFFQGWATLADTSIGNYSIMEFDGPFYGQLSKENSSRRGRTWCRRKGMRHAQARHQGRGISKSLNIYAETKIYVKKLKFYRGNMFIEKKRWNCMKAGWQLMYQLHTFKLWDPFQVSNSRRWLLFNLIHS